MYSLMILIGPGSYNIPRNGVEIKKKDSKLQCFDSTVNRFQDVSDHPSTHVVMHSYSRYHDRKEFGHILEPTIQLHLISKRIE